MAASTRPVIFLGYVVTKPWMPRRKCCQTVVDHPLSFFFATDSTANPYGILVQEGNVHDVDMDDNDRW